MRRISLSTIIVTVSVIILLSATTILFLLNTKPKEELATRIIDSIESILSDWEALQEDEMNITITADMAAIYTPESLKTLCGLLGGDDDLRISVYYTNCFNSFNRDGKIIVTNDFIGIPFIDNEGFNIYYYFMVSGEKVYDIGSGHQLSTR